MSDKIKISTEHLDSIASSLKSLAGKLRSASDTLDGIWMNSTTANHTVRSGSCRLSGNAGVSGVTLGSTRSTVRRYENALSSYEDLCQSLSKRVLQVKDRFIRTEGEISALANGDADEVGSLLSLPKDITEWTAEMWNVYMAGSAGLAAERNGLLDRLDASFDGGALLKKLIGSFGPIGSLATMGFGIYDGIKTGDWTEGLKGFGDSLVSWSQFLSKNQWSNYSKLNRFGNSFGTKSYAKKLFSLAKETNSAAAKWGDRFKRNFSNGLEGTFRTFDPKTGSYKANWFGIAGTLIDLGANAYGNYKQAKAGEISGDRAVVETVAETAANLLIGTAASAAAAALLPVSAPAVAIAAGGAAIVWVADSVTKLVTGGDKGLGELASEGVGWAYDKGKELAVMAYDKGKEVVSDVIDKGKEVVSGAIDKGKEVVSGAIDKGKDFLEGLYKKAVGRSRAIWI